MFPKQKRIVDKELIKAIGRLPCVACNRRWLRAEAHHVTTRGSGGDDTFDNLMPLCREHHTEYHGMGAQRMLEKYSGVLRWLKEMGRDDIINKGKS